MTIPKFTAPGQIITTDALSQPTVTNSAVFNPDTTTANLGDLATIDGLITILAKSDELDSLAADGVLTGLDVTLATGPDVLIANGTIWSRAHGTKSIAGATITITPAEQDSQFLSSIVVNKSTGVISNQQLMRF